MRLFQLEVKRVLKTRMTWVLLALSLFLAVFLAYLPVTFRHYIYLDENGTRVELSGRKAAQYVKNRMKDLEGEVTTDKIQKALEETQACLKDYGVEGIYELPTEVAYERLLIYNPFLHGVQSVFADKETGTAPDIMELDASRMKDYYENCSLRLSSLMRLEEEDYPSAVQKAEEMYREVTFPFTYYYGINSEVLEYETFLIFLITVFGAMIAAPVFSAEYQTGADDILRCTRHGRLRLGMVKVSASVLVCGCAYVLCLLVWMFVTNGIFGWESTKTSIQMLFAITSLPNMNAGQLERFGLCACLVAFLAMVSFVLFLSSRMKNTVSAMALSVMFCLLPMFVDRVAPGAIGDWIRCLLPGGGTGLLDNVIFAWVDVKFLHLGQLSFWSPWVMLAAAAVEIPVFSGLAIASYCRRNA